MVGTSQLLAIGLTRAAIKWLVRSGRLMPYCRGVYRVGPFLQPYGLVMAALLACPGAVASHETSAWLHKVAPRPRDVHVICPTRRRSRPGLVVHTAALRPDEIWSGEGLVLTSPLRTLSDLRGTAMFEKAVWEASYRRLISDDEATALLGRRAPTAKHEGERVLQDLIRRAGLPEPLTNVRVGRWEVDFLWPELGVVVELDGEDGHGHGLGAARDVRKQRDLTERGIALHRVSGEELKAAPEAVLTRLAVALARAA